MSEEEKDIGKIMEEMLNIPLELIEENKKLKKKIEKLQKENDTLKTTINKQSKDISEQLQELDKKDKVIDLMALHIASSAIVDDMVCMYKDCENENCTADMSIQCTKEYFYKKAEE